MSVTNEIDLNPDKASSDVRRVAGLVRHREARSARKRASILEAASEVFIENGYERSSVTAIAERAEVALGTIYKQFNSKEQLFANAMGAGVEEVRDVLRRARLPDAPEDALRLLARTYIDIATKRRMVGLLQVVAAEVSRWPELGRLVVSQQIEPLDEWIYGYLEAATQKGLLSVGNIPRATAQFMGMLNQNTTLPYIFLGPGATPLTPSFVDEVVEEAVLTFLARYGAVPAARS
jgi:TetR/AcrR family transcriptional regulator, regulator of autoinduction and epiphytic fitness